MLSVDFLEPFGCFVSRQGTDGKIFTRWHGPHFSAAKLAAAASLRPLPRPVQRFTQLCGGDAALGQRLFEELRKDLSQRSPT